MASRNTLLLDAGNMRVTKWQCRATLHFGNPGQAGQVVPRRLSRNFSSTCLHDNLGKNKKRTCWVKFRGLISLAGTDVISFVHERRTPSV